MSINIDGFSQAEKGSSWVFYSYNKLTWLEPEIQLKLVISIWSEVNLKKIADFDEL